MCLACPAEVIELLGNDMAVVSMNGIKKSISVALVAGVKTGDYVIVHVGYAINLLDCEEAQKTLSMFAEMTGSLSPAV